MATIRSIRSGGWSDPATWNLGRTPRDGDRVIIGNDTRVVCEPHMAPIRGSQVEFEGMGGVLDTSKIKLTGVGMKGATSMPSEEK